MENKQGNPSICAGIIGYYQHIKFPLIPLQGGRACIMQETEEGSREIGLCVRGCESLNYFPSCLVSQPRAEEGRWWDPELDI